ncbi:MAG: DNA-binding transcriptional regulator, partial [Clostridia bacterium]|nr:DNA-binding transcriptional regulator [Clostridia bacterium]
IGDEMRLIVDLGGYILNTHVDHPIYGSVGESLRIKSRRDIQNFLTKTEETGCMPLLALTNGVHSHTIAAEDEQTLDEICAELQNAGYLMK